MNVSKVRILILVLILCIFAGITTVALAQNAVDQPQGTAHVKFAHFAPFSSIAADTEVTVKFGDNIEFSFMYEDIHPFHPDEVPPPESYIEIESGTYLVEVTLLGESNPIISENITITENSWDTISVIGNGTDQNLELLQLIDESPGSTNPEGALVRFTHVAPLAPEIADTHIDVCTAAGEIWMGLADMAYTDFNDPYMLVLPGDYDLLITAAGSDCGTVYYDFPELHFKTGQVADMFFIGDGELQPFFHATTTGLLYVLPEEVGYVNIAHVAPYENNHNLEAIRVIIDSEIIVDDFDFLQFSGYLEISSGEHAVEMVQVSSNQTLATGTINIELDKYYTLHLIGDGDNQPLEVWLLEDDVVPLDVNAKIRIVNAAPLSANLEETKLDVCNADDTIVDALTGVPYKGYTDPYEVFESGYYRLKGSKSGTDCVQTITGLFPYLMQDGDVATIYMFGANLIPTGQVSYPDISAFMIYLNIIWNYVLPIP